MRISDWSSDVCSSDLLVIGVNGSGKTTTIAKLAHLFQEQDYGVMLAAGDTLRAAAIGQLKVWAERLGVPIVTGKEGGDAAGDRKSVVSGKSVSVRVDLGGRGMIQKNNKLNRTS